MRWFDDLSIRYKLIVLFVLMGCISAIAASLPMGVAGLLELRQAMVIELETVADVLAKNSTAALTFRDADVAHDTLEALRAESGVTRAYIYTSDGKALAAYTRSGEPVPAPAAERPNIRFQQGHIHLFREITFSREKIGTIYLESDVKKLDTRLREYLLAGTVSLLLTLALAVLLATRLQRPISRPVTELLRTAQAVSRTGDYSLRAGSLTRDEFGQLVAAFNGMLGQIADRDRELCEHRETLEQQVAARTAELLSANVQLHRAEEKYRALFEDAVVGIFQITPDGKPLSVNRALADMHGFDSPEQYMNEVANVAFDLFVEPSRMSELASALAQHGIVRGAEIQVYRRNGSKKWVRANIRSVCDPEGTVFRWEGTIEDVTERKAAEERVQFLAYYDALTGLANRTLLQDRLEKALAGARRAEKKVAVLFLDLDRFKIINDSLGHSVGDLLLQGVADRLKSYARAEDTVARIGGDEFLITLTNLQDVRSVGVVAERIMNSMAPAFEVQGRPLNVSCSIGISIFPEHGCDSETLIKNADAAMYAAKESGRNAFRFFTEDMSAQVVERLNLEHSLRKALENQEIFLVYQPQINIETGAIVGVEALLRWRNPELGLVAPDRFIRVAENTGIIIPMGDWALRRACLDAQKWQLPCADPVVVAVNVSAVQFRQNGFRHHIRQVLSETGLRAALLELELTETLLLSNADVTFPVLEEFRSMGVKLAIDDFGTGYSSLSYLRQFPVNKLKIDRSFIKHVATNPDDAAITAAIIGMAKSLNLKVIAEGVEDEAQMSFLRAHHCDEIQGYYFSHPMSAEEITERILSSRSQALCASASL